jgi:hypothetical protein
VCNWDSVAAIGELLQGLAAMGAIVVAAAGLRTWLTQRKHRYAERAVVLARRFQAQASACRRPFRFSPQNDEMQELWDGMTELGQTARKIRELEWLAAAQGRMADVSRGLGHLCDLFFELRAALILYTGLCRRESEVSAPLTPSERDTLSQNRQIVYGSDGDDYSRKVMDAVETIETAARAFIR